MQNISVRKHTNTRVVGVRRESFLMNGGRFDSAQTVCSFMLFCLWPVRGIYLFTCPLWQPNTEKPNTHIETMVRVRPPSHSSQRLTSHTSVFVSPPSPPLLENVVFCAKHFNENNRDQLDLDIEKNDQCDGPIVTSIVWINLFFLSLSIAVATATASNPYIDFLEDSSFCVVACSADGQRNHRGSSFSARHVLLVAKRCGALVLAETSFRIWKFWLHSYCVWQFDIGPGLWQRYLLDLIIESEIS